MDHVNQALFKICSHPRKKKTRFPGKRGRDVFAGTVDVLKSALLDLRNSGFDFVGSVCRAAATSDRKTMENKKSGRLFRSNIGLTLCGHARDFMDKLSLEKDLAPFYKSTTRHTREVFFVFGQAQQQHIWPTKLKIAPY